MSRSLKFLSLAGVAATLMAAGPPPSLTLSPAQSGPVQVTLGTPQVRNVKAKGGVDYTTAPVPNSDAAIPFVKNPRQNQAQLAPSIFAPPATGYRGEGYVPGSTAEGEQQRKIKPAPGFNLKVPLN